MGRRQADGGSVKLWPTFGWENLSPSIHADATVTHTAYLKIVAEHIHTFTAMVFPDGSGLFQQDNTSCRAAKIVQEWFEEHDKEFKVLPCPPNSPDLNLMEHPWDVLEHQN